LETRENHLRALDYTSAALIARKTVHTLLQHHLPAGILLNVNIPYLPLKKIKGYNITRQGKRVYRDRLDPRVDPRGQAYFWIGGDATTGLVEKGTDIGGLAIGYVSITPLQLDLTAYPALHQLGAWKWEDIDDQPEGAAWHDNSYQVSTTNQ